MITATQSSTLHRFRGLLFLASVLFGVFLISVIASSDNRMIPATPSPLESPSPALVAVNSADEAQVRAFVAEFGTKFQLVPTTADKKIFQAAVEKEYGDFISSQLLEYWKQNPDRTPGKTASGFVPTRIEVTSVNADDAETYEVIGYVVETTGVAADKPVEEPMMAVVERQNGAWTITSFVQSDL